MQNNFKFSKKINIQELLIENNIHVEEDKIKEKLLFLYDTNLFFLKEKDLVIKKLKQGKNIVFDIDWQGTRQIRNKKLNYQLKTFFILPPSKKELQKRLIKREKKNMKTVKKRMKEFKKDLSRWKEYDYVVINDDIKKCYKKIMDIIKKNKLQQNHVFINNHVKNLLR